MNPNMNNPKSILLIAPFCYPIWGPEANVNSKFIKTLTDGGYVVDLISAKCKVKTYPDSDSEFYVSGVREKILVDSDPLSKFKLSKIKRKLYSLIVSSRIRTIVDLSVIEVRMIKVVDLLCKIHKYDYVITKHRGDNAGFYCAKKYGVTLLYTFNDPWPRKKNPKPYGYGPTCPITWVEKQALKNIAKLSYKIIFPSTRLKDYVMQYLPQEAQNKGIIFPHTVTSALINSSKNQNTNPELHIMHTGSTGMCRDPEVLFKGLRLFLDKHNDAKFKIQFVGVEEMPLPGRSIKDYIQIFHLENYIEEFPPVSYETSIEYISKSDVCLILEANCEEGIFMPTKITDYQQCGKPIWAISPAVGVLNDLYKTNDIEYFSEVTSAISVRDAFEKIYNDYISSGGTLKRNDSTLFYDVNIIKEIHKCLDAPDIV